MFDNDVDQLDIINNFAGTNNFTTKIILYQNTVRVASSDNFIMPYSARYEQLDIIIHYE